MRKLAENIYAYGPKTPLETLGKFIGHLVSEREIGRTEEKVNAVVAIDEPGGNRNRSINLKPSIKLYAFYAGL